MSTGTEQRLGMDKDLQTRFAHDPKLSSLRRTFRNIHIVVLLLLVFAVMQMLMLQRVCNTGMKTASSLEHQGLPFLNLLGNLKEHLALFRLDSYQYIFTQESERPAKAKAVRTIVEKTRADLDEINSLMPTPQGKQLATNLESSFNDLNQEFNVVQSLVDTNFAEAMAAMDHSIPPRIDATLAAEGILENYGYHLSAQQANATFGSLGWIKDKAVAFGTANIIVSLGAVMFVLMAARRTSTQLTANLKELNEQSEELANSLSLLNATLDSTADAIVAIDHQNKVSCYNQPFIKLWKFSEEMLGRKRTAEIMTLCAIQTKDPKLFLEQLENQHNTPDTEQFYTVEFNDGRTVECYAKPQLIHQQLAGVVLNFRDVTERKRALADLAYERELLRSLLDTSAENIYFKDKESRFIRCSASQARFFKVAGPAELVGKTDFDFFTREHAQPAFDDEQQIIQTGRPVVGKQEKETWPDGHVTWALTNKMPLRNAQGEVIGTFGISKDITEIKHAEAKLEAVHRQLVDASRQAGMAEVATNVLHNVGNVLNSINVSTTLMQEKVKKSKVNNLGRASALIQEHINDLAVFLAEDPKGRQLPDYLLRLSQHLAAEQAELLLEIETTRKNIEHVKDIVAMQQNYAKVSGITEKISVVDLVEDSLRMNVGALARHDVHVARDYPAHIPEINVEKHKVLQILVNLIRNAKYACDESGRPEKQMTLQVRNGDDRVRIAVIDNGVGIPGENLTRIFNHGFTTRQKGHGFGLHSGALTAKELGGSLTVYSEGVGRGATFTLELPLQPPPTA